MTRPAAVILLLACGESVVSLPQPLDASAPPLPTSRPIDVDVLVAGASAGGISAAIQAARLGRTVALIEETDHVGGQMLTVTAMDEAGADNRVNGLYAEFAQRIVAAYAPNRIDYCGAGLCYEARTGETVLRAMLAEAGVRVLTGVHLVSVQRSGNLVTGATAKDGRVFTSRILIDATEWGDVMPLANVPYRLGNGRFDPTTGSTPDPSACVQEITSTVTIRWFDGGVPAELDLRGADAGDDYPAYFDLLEPGIVRDGPDAGPCTNQVWSWTCHARYRATPDRDNPLAPRHLPTKTTINALNDYPTILSWPDAGWPVAAVEDRARRWREECKARRLTLQFLFYGQDWLGVDWGVADEVTAFGNTTPCDADLIPPQWRGSDRLFPQTPYVRESRRLLGVHTLSAPEIFRVPAPGVSPGFDKASQRRFATSLAVGYYGTNLHGCYGPTTLEGDLETEADRSSGGPFQIPFGAFIPREVDGFLVAEKNLSQSRLVNGATRLQPICFATGQAAGVIAAKSIERGVQPRALPPLVVQGELLAARNALSLQGFTDVPRGHARWAAAQLVSTHGILGGYGNFTFGVSDGLTRAAAAVLLQRTLRYPLAPVHDPPTFSDVPPAHFAHRFVESMAAEGLTSGCGGGLFCPDATATNAQLAFFVVAGLKEGPAPCAGSVGPYPDVPATHPLCGHIAKLKSLGLAVGCAAGYCPDVAATRGDAAELASRTLLRLATAPGPVGACYRTPPDYCER